MAVTALENSRSLRCHQAVGVQMLSMGETQIGLLRQRGLEAVPTGGPFGCVGRPGTHETHAKFGVCIQEISDHRDAGFWRKIPRIAMAICT